MPRTARQHRPSQGCGIRWGGLRVNAHGRAETLKRVVRRDLLRACAQRTCRAVARDAPASVLPIGMLIVGGPIAPPTGELEGTHKEEPGRFHAIVFDGGARLLLTAGIGPKVAKVDISA